MSIPISKFIPPPVLPEAISFFPYICDSTSIL